MEKQLFIPAVKMLNILIIVFKIKIKLFSDGEAEVRAKPSKGIAKIPRFY